MRGFFSVTWAKRSCKFSPHHRLHHQLPKLLSILSSLAVAVASLGAVVAVVQVVTEHLFLVQLLARTHRQNPH
jgi:hypothetical protein